MRERTRDRRGARLTSGDAGQAGVSSHCGRSALGSAAARECERRGTFVVRRRGTDDERRCLHDDRRFARSRSASDDATHGAIRRVHGNAPVVVLPFDVGLGNTFRRGFRARVRDRRERREQQLEDGREDEAEPVHAGAAH